MFSMDAGVFPAASIRNRGIHRWGQIRFSSMGSMGSDPIFGVDGVMMGSDPIFGLHRWGQIRFSVYTTIKRR